MGLPPRPYQPDLHLSRMRQPVLPSPDPLRFRTQIRYRCRDRTKFRAENPRQAHQRDEIVTMRRWSALFENAVDARKAVSEIRELAHHGRCAQSLNPWRVAQ